MSLPASRPGTREPTARRAFFLDGIKILTSSRIALRSIRTRDLHLVHGLVAPRHASAAPQPSRCVVGEIAACEKPRRDRCAVDVVPNADPADDSNLLLHVLIDNDGSRLGVILRSRRSTISSRNELGLSTTLVDHAGANRRRALTLTGPASPAARRPRSRFAGGRARRTGLAVVANVEDQRHEFVEARHSLPRGEDWPAKHREQLIALGVDEGGRGDYRQRSQSHGPGMTCPGVDESATCWVNRDRR